MIRRVLVIGGLDPGGGAGLTADACVLHAHGAMALPVATTWTAQNRFGATRVEAVPAAMWQAAMAAAVGDGEVHAIKTGLLASATQVRALAGCLRPLAARVPLVVDPVLSVTAGGYAAAAEVAAAYRTDLAPLATVFTPNAPELAAVLGSGSIAALLRDGCRAVLCKGGHADGGVLTDRLVTVDGARDFVHPRRPAGPVHGTGCALASALASGLAHGLDLASACAGAIDYLQRCLQAMGLPDASGRPRPLALLNGTSSR